MVECFLILSALTYDVLLRIFVVLKDFMMDPEIEVKMKQQLTDKVELVKKQMAWEAEKCLLAKKKLENRYNSVHMLRSLLYVYYSFWKSSCEWLYVVYVTHTGIKLWYKQNVFL